jgi:hypothetical protein
MLVAKLLAFGTKFDPKTAVRFQVYMHLYQYIYFTSGFIAPVGRDEPHRAVYARLAHKMSSTKNFLCTKNPLLHAFSRYLNKLTKAFSTITQVYGTFTKDKIDNKKYFWKKG